MKNNEEHLQYFMNSSIICYVRNIKYAFRHFFLLVLSAFDPIFHVYSLFVDSVYNKGELTVIEPKKTCVYYFQLFFKLGF